MLQGSVLGPLLFLQYINDIMRITSTKDDNNKSKLVLFPDDTSLIITSPNPINFIKESQIIVRKLCSLLKLYYGIHNSILNCKRGVVAAYHVVWECVVEQWLGLRHTTHT